MPNFPGRNSIITYCPKCGSSYRSTDGRGVHFVCTNDKCGFNQWFSPILGGGLWLPDRVKLTDNTDILPTGLVVPSGDQKHLIGEHEAEREGRNLNHIIGGIVQAESTSLKTVVDEVRRKTGVEINPDSLTQVGEEYGVIPNAGVEVGIVDIYYAIKNLQDWQKIAIKMMEAEPREGLSQLNWLTNREFLSLNHITPTDREFVANQEGSEKKSRLILPLR